jgi:DNA primase
VELLEQLICEDFGLQGRENARWAKSDDHSSLVLDRDKNVFYWNSKHIVGDALTYLMKVRGMPFWEAKAYLKEHNWEQTYVYTVKQVGDDVVAFPELVNLFAEAGIHNREYWYIRCLKDSIINRFQLGYHDGWYLIPFFVNGTFRDFQMRRDEPKKMMKHWYKGLDPFLLNSDILKFTNEIIITEAPTDAILLSQYNINAVSHNGGAGFWNKSWTNAFIKQKKIYLVYDNDDAGRKGAINAAKNLGENRTYIYNFAGFKEKYDTGDWFKEGNCAEDYLNLVKGESRRWFLQKGE